MATTTTDIAADAGAATLIQLIWLASPALPVGSFSYSEGLEAAVEAGLVTHAAQAGEWLQDQLLLGQARGDLAVAAGAFLAWRARDLARIVALNAWVQATRESSEIRQQAEQMGRSLTDWLRQRDPADPRVDTLAALRPAPTWPVALALAAERTGAPLRTALLALAFGWAENMVQAAVKSVPLGQSAGQALLAGLAALIPAAVDDAINRDDDTRFAFTPMLAILSAQHETQYSRLFRS
jgi:urease accessory protein